MLYSWFESRRRSQNLRVIAKFGIAHRLDLWLFDWAFVMGVIFVVITKEHVNEHNGRGVAQFSSALALGARGPGSEARLPDQNYILSINDGMSCL